MKRKFLTALFAIFCAICLTMVSACDLLGNSSGTNSGGDEKNTEQTGGNTSGNTSDDGSTSGGGNTDGGSTEHTHTLVKTEAKEATCTSEGNIEYWSCTGCGKYFADSSAETEITMDDIVLSVSHTYSGSWTCTLCGNQLTESEGLEYYDYGTCYAVEIGSCTDSEIVIPYTHNGLPVAIILSFQPDIDDSESTRRPKSINSINIPDSIIRIEDWAFGGNTSLKTVNIPKNVSYIGEGPFAACSSLTNITVDKENEYYKSVDGNLYSYDGTILVQYALGKPETSFTIPEGVTIINAGAFTTTDDDMEFCAECSLTEVITPDSMTTINYHAFMWAGTLSSIVLADSVKTIESGAFVLCVSLISITIPKNVTSMKCSFYYCFKLVEICNLSSVKLTKNDFDSNCNIQNIYTASSGQSNLVNQDGYVFYNDNGSYYLMGYIGTETDLVLPETINGNTYELYYYAFLCNTKITSVVIPDTITTITTCAFALCVSLETVLLPESITSIEFGAFGICTSLKRVTIPDGIKSISEYTFYNCISLESITIPDSLTSIGKYAFEDCSAIKELNISISDMVAWCSDSKLMNLFELLANTLTDYFSDKLSYEQHSCYRLYYNGALLTDLIIPEGVTSIGKFAFAYCSSIRSITIPSSVTSIGYGAFAYCDNLTSVTFEAASGWYISETAGAASDTSVGVTDASKNAEYLTDTYDMYYWYKK